MKNLVWSSAFVRAFKRLVRQNPQLRFEVLLNPEDSGLTKPSKIQAQQVRTISKQRIIGEVYGSLNKEMMVLIDAALKLHLGLG